MMRKAFSSRSLSLIRSQSRSFSSSIYNRSAAPPANGEEETLEQRVRREISEEQDVDYFTNFGKKYPIVSHEIEIEQLEKEHKKLDQELTFWPYIHAVVVAVLLYLSVKNFLDRKARLNQIFNEKFKIDL